MLAAFEKKHRASGKLVVIGMHGQNESPDKVAALCKSRGVEYPIVQGNQYTKKQVPGIPRAFVFDHTGREIFDGNPSGAEAAAEKALADAPALWLGETTYTKLKPLAVQVEKKEKLGSAAAALRAKLQSSDEAEKTEAEALLQVIDGYASRCKASAASLREENADQYLARLDALAKELAGDSTGDEFKTLKDKEAADPEFQKLRKGLKELADQAKAVESLPCCKACKGKSMKSISLSCETCKQANAEALTTLKKALAALQKKYEGTAVATKAADLAGSL